MFVEPQWAVIRSSVQRSRAYFFLDVCWVMEKTRVVILLVASVFILFGYFRFISDEKGNVNLNNYRFTGGLFLVIGGLVEGTRDLFSLDMTRSGLSALAIWLGALLFYVGFNI